MTLRSITKLGFFLPRKLVPFRARGGQSGSLLSIILLAFLSFCFARNCYCAGTLDSLVENSLKVSLLHLEKSIEEVRDSTLYPTYGTPELSWKLKGSDDWTSGFYPGCLWYAYEASADTRFEQWAITWTAAIEHEALNRDTHDLGFRFMCSFGNGLRLGIGPGVKAYRDVMLTAASTLSKRYNPKIGCLSSNWDRASLQNSFPVIIDIMMNLDLLFWAAQNGGPHSYTETATRHARNVCRDFIRPDGGTYHIVRYDSVSGKIINRGTLQGAGDETTWSRGQAWGLYGMAVAYRYTKDKEFLEAAEKLADYFLLHLAADHVANWDFNSELNHPDASATSIAASALLELLGYVENDTLREHYRTGAEAMLSSLCHSPYFTDGLNTHCLLTHSVQYFPLNSNVDVPSIFADYYFLEALLRYRALRKTESH